MKNTNVFVLCMLMGGIRAHAMDNNSTIVVYNKAANLSAAIESLQSAYNLKSDAVADHVKRVAELALSDDSMRLLQEDPHAHPLLLLDHLGGDELKQRVHRFMPRLWEKKHEIRSESSLVSAAFSPFGDELVLATNFNEALIVDTFTGAMRTIETHYLDRLTGAVFHGSCSSRLAISTESKYARVMSLLEDPAEERCAIRHGIGAVYAVAFADSDRVITAGQDHKVKITEVHTGELLAEIVHKGPVFSVAVAPNQEYFVTASGDKTSKVVDMNALQEVRSLVHDESVVGVVFAPDSSLFATRCNDGTISIFDAKSYEKLRTINQEGRVKSFVFSLDNRSIIIATEDGLMNDIDVKTGHVLHTMKYNEKIKAVCFSRDNTLKATAFADRTAVIEQQIPSNTLSQALLTYYMDWLDKNDKKFERKEWIDNVLKTHYARAKIEELYPELKQ